MGKNAPISAQCREEMGELRRGRRGVPSNHSASRVKRKTPPPFKEKERGTVLLTVGGEKTVD